MRTYVSREEAYQNVLPFDVEDARVRFLNFSGIGSQYNREGDRNFTLIINPEDVEELTDKGWNVRPKTLDEDEVEYRLNVAVSFRSFKNIPPVAIYTHCNGVTTKISEETVADLDNADIRSIDLTVRPRAWEDYKTGELKIKAFLKEMHVVLNPNRWQEKYAAMEHPEE